MARKDIVHWKWTTSLSLFSKSFDKVIKLEGIICPLALAFWKVAALDKFKVSCG